jgi:hypothetical protein
VPLRKKPPPPPVRARSVTGRERFLAALREQRELSEKLKLPDDLRDWLDSPGERKLRDDMRRLAMLLAKPEPTASPQPAPRKSKRGRRRTLTEDDITLGRTELAKRPGKAPKENYDFLRQLLNTDASDTTLWRRIIRRR